jgi:Na+/H+-dicarboxylate symporter
VGATASQNGTALFEGVTVLFLAQFFGVELGLGQQLLVMGVCILGMVGVPPENIGLILGVDRFLDMCRTTVNVTGDLAVAVVVSRGES